MLNMFAKLVADSQFTWKIWINITTNRCIPERVARRYPCPGSGSSSPPYSLHVLTEWLLQQGVSPSSAWKTKVADVQQKPEGGKRYLHKHIQLFCRPSSFLLTISQSIPWSSTLSPLLSIELGRLNWMRFLASLPLFTTGQDLLLLPSLLCVGGGGVGSLKGFLNW